MKKSAIILGIASLAALSSTAAKADSISFSFTPTSNISLGEFQQQVNPNPQTLGATSIGISSPGTGVFAGATGATVSTISYFKTNPATDALNPATGFDSVMTVNFGNITLLGSCALCSPTTSFITPAVTTTANATRSQSAGIQSDVITQAAPNFISATSSPPFSQSIGFTFQLATSFFLANPSSNIRSGVFTLTSPINPVPYPLPVIGAAAAFGFSRKLRKRISQAKAV